MEVTLRPSPQDFPAGVKAKAYVEALRAPGSRLTGKPAGAQIAEATVASNGTLTFTGLTEGTNYVGWVQVAGVDKYVRFATGPGEAAVELEQVRAELAEAALAASVGLEGAMVANVKAFGALGDNTTDDAVAIAAAKASLATRGGILYFPPGIYLASQTLELTNEISVLGAGAGVNAKAPTIIRPSAGVTGIICTGAGMGLLSRFMLLSRSTEAGEDDGIQVLAHGTVLDDVCVEGFGRDGVSSNTAAAHNANVSSYRSVRSARNFRHGFYTTGTNSVAVNKMSCHAQFNKGWGFYDDRGGSVSVGCVTEGNTLGGFFDNGNSNQYYAPYVEPGTGYNVTLSGHGTTWINSGSFTDPPLTVSGTSHFIVVDGELISALIGTAALLHEAVTGEKLSTFCVSGANIIPAAVTGEKVAKNTLTGDKFAVNGESYSAPAEAASGSENEPSATKLVRVEGWLEKAGGLLEGVIKVGGVKVFEARVESAPNPVKVPFGFWVPAKSKWKPELGAGVKCQYTQLVF